MKGEGAKEPSAATVTQGTRLCSDCLSPHAYQRTNFSQQLRALVEVALQMAEQQIEI
jgi:hypothetical protein